jgi:hypothetical protein
MASARGDDQLAFDLDCLRARDIAANVLRRLHDFGGDGARHDPEEAPDRQPVLVEEILLAVDDQRLRTRVDYFLDGLGCAVGFVKNRVGVTLHAQQG